MNWINFTWPLATGAFLTMALVHLWTGLRRPGGRANVLFAISAIFAAIYSWFELRMTQAGSPEEFLGHLRFLDLAAGGMSVSLAIFVWDYFGTARKWFGLIAIGVMVGSLIPDLLPVPKLVFLEITGIQEVPTFGGATYTVADGVSSPWNLIFYGGVFLILSFVADASFRLWRRGDRRKALVTGGTVVLFFLFGGLQAYLTDVGVLRSPYLVTYCWMAILIVMAWELSNDQLRAAQLTHDLRENQDRMRLAVRAANLSLWEWDMSRDEFWANEAGRARIGVGESEHISFTRVLQSVHPDDRKSVRQIAGSLLESGEEIQVDYRTTDPDGITRWVVSRGRVERDRKGNPLFIRGVSVDITKRKRAEISLRESESRFRTLADTAPVLIWMSGTDKLCNYFNKGWINYTGRSLDQELGNGWVEGVHPDDVKRCMEIYTTSFDARREFSMEYRLRKHNGEYGWVLDTGVPRFADDGQFLGYIGSCVDISSQKDAEERFRLVVEGSPSAMVVVDGEGVITLINAQCEKVFGYGRDEIIGQPIEALLPERIWQRHVRDRAGYLALPTARSMGVGQELFGRRKDGSEMPVEIGLNPIHIADQKFVLASIIDITARKQTEADLQRQRAEIAHAQRVSATGQLATTLAHELNQPLGAILRNAEAAELFLQQDPPDLEELRAILADIRHDDQRATAVIEHMRSLLKRRDLQIETFAVGELIEPMVKLLHAETQMRHATLCVEIPREIPRVRVDRVHLQQVILNLVLNSLDASHGQLEDHRQKGQQQIIIRASQAEEGMIELAVIDKGAGIPPDLLPRLFDPFVTTKSQGTGLGLAITKTIVELQGGKISAANNPDGGATFRFTLPAEGHGGGK